MNIGVHCRSEDDNYAISVDFSALDVFVSNPITSASVLVVPEEGSSGTLVATHPATVLSNVATFRISGGQAGDRDRVKVTATNGVDVICRSLEIKTGEC